MKNREILWNQHFQIFEKTFFRIKEAEIQNARRIDHINRIGKAFYQREEGDYCKSI